MLKFEEKVIQALPCQKQFPNYLIWLLLSLTLFLLIFSYQLNIKIQQHQEMLGKFQILGEQQKRDSDVKENQENNGIEIGRKLQQVQVQDMTVPGNVQLLPFQYSGSLWFDKNNAGTFQSIKVSNSKILPKFAVASINLYADTDDHFVALLGDLSQLQLSSNQFFQLWTQSNFNPSFGSNLIAVTSPGETDKYKSSYGVWQQVLLPIIQTGNYAGYFQAQIFGYSSGALNGIDKIHYNIIGFLY